MLILQQLLIIMQSAEFSDTSREIQAGDYFFLETVLQLSGFSDAD